MNEPTGPAFLAPSDDRMLQALQTRLALRLTAGLDELVQDLPHDIDERLRFAREQALAVAAQQRAGAGVVAVTRGGGAVAGGWWTRMAAVLPLLLLAGGLVLIQQQAVDEQVEAVATIDTALLVDDLPPAAYSDPGFLAFLRNPPPLAPATVTQ